MELPSKVLHTGLPMFLIHRAFLLRHVLLAAKEAYLFMLVNRGRGLGGRILANDFWR
jgi:hypothetical protein